ncbi:ThiF family adenylyltransferase [Mucilaginibacter sp. HMF5004]|uniref:ThiF family adenylyltransferase n=1 Tax=Mucilaginibacter rivuli TaxID=2857527 RepID=UPI001C5F7CDD|nr:ThiF family adenylyltransferase [Mucilaginibacter rivuli]MBW4889312.1 ThiF family adenylyltransferase [Mucilaginibacter rivuli]
MNTEQDKYYQSHSKLQLIGQQGQAKLSAAKVLVIGAGGLGCPCLLTLATAGIGNIGIADFDTVSVSNLHRQTLYTMGDVGQLKAKIAHDKIVQYNTYINVNQIDMMINESNVLDIISQYDMVVDGTDNFATRYLVNDACVYLGKPLVYGAIYQTEGHVTVFNYHNSATLRCLFPEPDAETYVPSCAEVGAYNVVTQIIGVMMANEVVKIVTGNDDVLSNKLLTYDAIAPGTRTISYRAKPESREVSMARFEQKEQPADMSIEEFLNLDEDTYQLLDVREDWEREEYNIGGLHLPLAAINSFKLLDLSQTGKIVVYCEQGSRSAAAVQYLRKKGFINAVSLQGGIVAYQKLVP